MNFTAEDAETRREESFLVFLSAFLCALCGKKETEHEKYVRY